MSESDTVNGLSALELRDLGPCCVCEKPLGETGYPLFFRLEFDGHLVDVPKLRDGFLQSSFGVDGDCMTPVDPKESLTRWMDKRELMLCVMCMLARFPELMMEGVNND